MLNLFCKAYNVTPEELVQLPLEQIEIMAEHFIHQNEGKLAPKTLNVIYCAIKSWLRYKRVIKNNAQFRQIKFDKTSRMTSALKETMVETKHIKNGFKVANLEDKVDWGLYCLVGLRPSLIPQVRVQDIYEPNYILKNGKLKFSVNTPLVIIDRRFQGNKANIDFLVFLPSRLAEMVEMLVNTNGEVTKDTKLSNSDNAREIYYKIKTIYAHPSVNFRGRPYLLRKYADRILDRITRMFNDEDTKEFLMGHKGKISAVYQAGLNTEDERRMRDMYEKACDRWINETIFEMTSGEDIAYAKILSEMAEQLGVDCQALDDAVKLLTAGKMTINEYKARIMVLTRLTQERKMREQFEIMFLKMQEKHKTQFRTRRVTKPKKEGKLCMHLH